MHLSKRPKLNELKNRQENQLKERKRLSQSRWEGIIDRINRNEIPSREEISNSMSDLNFIDNELIKSNYKDSRVHIDSLKNSKSNDNLEYRIFTKTFLEELRELCGQSMILESYIESGLSFYDSIIKISEIYSLTPEYVKKIDKEKLNSLT